MFSVRRLFLALVALMMVTCAAYLVGRQYAEPAAAGPGNPPSMTPGTSTPPDPTVPADPTSTAKPKPSPNDTPTSEATGPEQDPTDEGSGTTTDGESEPEKKPEKEQSEGAAPAVFKNGDRSDGVRELQARLRQAGTFEHNVTGYYGDITAAAVRAFQTKHGLPATGAVDQATLDALEGATTEPTRDELDNTASVNEPGPLDERCLTGRVICVDKTSRTVRWVVDGQVLKTMDARFGAPGGFETGEGRFTVQSKSRDHVSSLYDAPMPFALFFNGGEAVHYSPGFVADGYSGYSHGCVNLRDRDGAEWLFDQAEVGDTVIVYWS